MRYAIVALLAFATSAQAQPPPAKWHGSFPTPMLVCKSSDQVKQLVDAQRVSEDKTKEAMTSLGDKCEVAIVSNILVVETEDLGTVGVGDGKFEHLWVVHLGNLKQELFGLYEEVEPPKQEVAI